MREKNKEETPVFRLMICHVLGLTQVEVHEETKYYLGRLEVSQVCIQGTVVKYKEHLSHYLFFLDDSTGVAKCVWFKTDSQSESLNVGDIVRVRGKLKHYRGELQVNVKGSPYTTEFDDEELEWLQDCYQIFHDIYTTKPPRITPTPRKPKPKPKNELPMKIVSQVRQKRARQISFTEVSKLFPEEPSQTVQNAVCYLVEKSFMEPKGQYSKFDEMVLEVSSKPFHPKEVIVNALRSVKTPLHVFDIQKLVEAELKEKCQNIALYLKQLVEEDIIYERDFKVYDLVN